jgi:hypothetical protein
MFTPRWRNHEKSKQITGNQIYSAEYLAGKSHIFGREKIVGNYRKGHRLRSIEEGCGHPSFLGTLA